VQSCLLFHGHGACSTELRNEPRVPDVLGLQIGDGTAQIVRLVVARERVGRAVT
jgi:cyclohexanecarboxyl-CoA dehydrogenase